MADEPNRKPESAPVLKDDQHLVDLNRLQTTSLRQDLADA
jgi:hypothetical protein